MTRKHSLNSWRDLFRKNLDLKVDTNTNTDADENTEADSDAEADSPFFKPKLGNK